MTTTIQIPRDTSARKIALLGLRFDGVAIESHDFDCASVDCDDEIAGAQMLAVVNTILFES
jgi:hypothetical protein